MDGDPTTSGDEPLCLACHHPHSEHVTSDVYPSVCCSLCRCLDFISAAAPVEHEDERRFFQELIGGE